MFISAGNNNTLNLPGRHSSHSNADSPTESTHPLTVAGKQRPRARSVETDPGRRVRSLEILLYQEA